MTALWMSSRRAGWILLVTLITFAAGGSIRKRNTDDGLKSMEDVEIDDFVPYQGQKFNAFDWELLQNMGKTHRGNLLISPISAKLALVLLYEGAQGDTAEELAKAMHLPAARSATRDRFSSILRSLQAEKSESSLSIGSRIFMDDNIRPRQRYCAIAKSFYQTDVTNTNFTNAQASVELVNNFVKNVTNGHIEKLFENESGLRDDLMIIVSAMFFQGTWHRNPFDVNRTKVDSFYMGDGKATIQVPYMRASSKFYLVYAEELDSKIMRIPYAGKKYSFVIILPQKPGKLDEVLMKLTPNIIDRHLWLMQEVPTDVMIPKFKFDFTSHLQDNLRQLGIRSIFDDTAMLTGIVRSKSISRPLAVTDIVQKAGIEVTERGTIAYAATEIEIGKKISDETFHATHPFLFYIEDESSGTILYMGAVNNPLEETGMASGMELPQIPQQQQQTSTQMQPTKLNEPENLNPDNATSAFGVGVDERQNYFNIELFQKLNQIKPGNVLVGTSSVKATMMVLAEAATGQTRQQIVSTLRLPSDTVQIRNVASNTISSFKDPKSGTELQVAIKLWLAWGVQVLKNYTDCIQHFYNSELQQMNFNDVTGSVNTINNWVYKHTYGHINSIVDSSSLAPDTRLMLTTAVYFKGTWQDAFDKKATRIRCFTTSLGCQQMPIMENIGMYKYAEVPALDAEVIQIPYTGGRVSMMVILPRMSGVQALDELSRNLAFAPISSILANLQETEILLQLPRFSINNRVGLRPTLDQLGIKDLFGVNAKLTSAFPRNNVHVGEIIHNARIEVSEEGTVAAAVTEAEVIPLMGSTLTVFRADRPFIFYLIDHQTNSILFAGRFVQNDDPTPDPTRH